MTMNDNLLATWDYSTDLDSTALIIPDGCQDLIIRMMDGQCPDWFVSSLYDHAQLESIQAGSLMTGFRFKAGVRVQNELLLHSLKGNCFENDEIFNRIDDFTYLKCSVGEALDCLASEVRSVAHASTEIGVSQRTLQRLLMKETNRSPVYWFMLARARRAARSLVEPIPLAEIADSCGYADQAHMSREFKHWFKVSPATIRNSPEILNQLNHLGYD